jgi:trk system potassium uptake protein TrkA
MNILVVGAGTVGTYLAEALLGEGHSVVMIESNKARLDEVASRLDVQAIHGAATDHAVLRRASVHQMDLALAMTNIDEVNLVCAFTCRHLGAQQTIARVRNPTYLEPLPSPYREHFGIDLLISPEMQTAVEITKFLENPDAVALESLAHGRVQMRQVELEKPCPVLGKRLAEAGFPEGVLVAGIIRENDIIIPSGTDRLHLGDAATLIGRPDALESAEPLLGQTTPEPKSIVIMGGGEVGENLARLLEPTPMHIVLIERDEKRCKVLSERLVKTAIIGGDATQIDLLREEHIGTSEVFVAATGEDEDNIMATVLAREMGVKQSIVLIHRPDYASIVQRMGFDHVLSPRVVTARHVLAHIRERDVRSIPVLGAGAEILELTAAPGAPAVGRPLREVKLPRGSLICAIVHGGEVHVAHGGHVIEPGATVIAIALTKSSKALRSRFS